MFRSFGRLVVALGVLASSLTLPVAALADEDEGDDDFLVAADHSSLVQGAATRVGLSVFPEDNVVDNKCYAIQIPAVFVIQSVPEITGTPGGSTWIVDVSGNRVRLRSTSGDGEIDDDERLSVAITVKGMTPGDFSWTIGGFDNDSCSGGPDEERSIPMRITAAAPAPTPAPTPVSTPAPTPQPPSATPRPTSTPVSPGYPGAPAQDLSSTTPPSPSPSATDSPDPIESALPGPAGRPDGGVAMIDSAGDAAATTVPAVGGDELFVSVSDGGAEGAAVQTQITSSGFSAMGMLDNAFEWFVPGISVGVPGMLILVVLGAQVMGGFVWLPAVRRSLHAEAKRRRPLRPVWL